jgi:hypothetical protein
VLASIDPVLYARVVHVGEGEVSAGELADFTRATDGARALGAWRASIGTQRASLFREAYRYWLGLRMPFLYRHAALTLAREQAEFRRLAAGHNPLREWRLPSNAPDPLELEVTPHGLSPRQLVDAAVALTSRRVEGRQGESGDSLHDSGTPAAARVLHIASTVVGDPALALRGLVPLIVASLHTTDPVQAFVQLATRLRAAPDECRAATPAQWWSLLHAWLGQMLVAADDVASPRPMLMADALRSRKEHPLITAAAREWESRADEDAAHRWFVLEAHGASHTIAEAVWRDFQPAVTVYSFDRGGNARHTMIVIDRDALSSVGASFSTGAVHQLLTVHGIMRRVGGFPSLEPRLCAHTSCKYHADAHCAWYPFVPREPARCGFPVRLARMRVEARGNGAAAIGDELPIVPIPRPAQQTGRGYRS